MLFFLKIAKIWFWFKKMTIGENVLEWGHVYYKTPLGSEREKLAFRKAIELWAEIDSEVLKIYPDYSPPDILRKCAFENMYVYRHNSFATLFQSILGSSDILLGDIGEASEYAKKESTLYLEKFHWWSKLLLSKPNDKEEDVALQELKKLGEIFSRMVIGNYLITIK